MKRLVRAAPGVLVLACTGATTSAPTAASAVTTRAAPIASVAPAAPAASAAPVSESDTCLAMARIAKAMGAITSASIPVVDVDRSETPAPFESCKRNVSEGPTKYGGSFYTCRARAADLASLTATFRGCFAKELAVANRSERDMNFTDDSEQGISFDLVMSPPPFRYRGCALRRDDDGAQFRCGTHNGD